MKLFYDEASTSSVFWLKLFDLDYNRQSHKYQSHAMQLNLVSYSKEPLLQREREVPSKHEIPQAIRDTQNWGIPHFQRIVNWATWSHEAGRNDIRGSTNGCMSKHHNFPRISRFVVHFCQSCQVHSMHGAWHSWTGKVKVQCCQMHPGVSKIETKKD